MLTLYTMHEIRIQSSKPRTVSDQASFSAKYTQDVMYYVAVCLASLLLAIPSFLLITIYKATFQLSSFDPYG